MIYKCTERKLQTTPSGRQEKAKSNIGRGGEYPHTQEGPGQNKIHTENRNGSINTEGGKEGEKGFKSMGMGHMLKKERGKNEKLGEVQGME